MNRSRFLSKAFSFTAALLISSGFVQTVLAQSPVAKESPKPRAAATPKPRAQAGGEYVEFLIGDRTEETRKWGHVSLRVVSAGSDQIFDFGRYGRMWGKRNASEGEPILRVWKNGSYNTYRNLHRADGGTTKRYRFESNAVRNGRILDYFSRMTNRARVHQSTGSFISYVSNGPTFHAVTVNCTTVSIDAFMAGFPEYNLHQMSYSKARDLQFYMRGAAQGEGNYSQDEMAWPRVWWPLDLIALLQEQYASRGFVRISPL